MAGILDNKKRIMDTVITTEGRRQVASGELRFSYVSFTDRHTFYQASGSNGVAEDASSRLYFEAGNRPQDQIIIETDDQANMLPFTGGEVEVFGNTLLESISALPGTASKRMTILSGSQTTGGMDKLLLTCVNNFQQQQLLGTKDIFADNSNFDIVPSNLTFKITDSFPYGQGSITHASLDHIESLFQDMRLSHLPNYRYLPPVNRRSPGQSKGSSLGKYKNMNQTPVLTYQELKNYLKGKESYELSFSETSYENNLVGQMFEIREGGIEKLSIIDFGEFPDEDPYSAGKRVFFIGKIYNDGYGNLTYINLFTLIFD